MCLKNCLTIVASLLSIIIQVSPVWAKNCPVSANSPADYQDRGDRCEGVLAQPVASFDIELLSAMAFHETVSSLPEHFNLKFYLPTVEKVYITVRELEQDTFYRLDDVRRSWRQGANDYQWSTKDALQRISGLKLDNLGVLIRLGGNEPRSREQVVPAIFYHQAPPASLSKYVFTFETNADAKLKYHLLQGETSILTQDLGIQQGGKPFQVRWENPSAKEGSYELVVEGVFVRDNTPVHQSVRFYHKPVLK